MGAEVFKEIMARLDELVSTLGQGAAHVYMIYVQQQIAYAAADYFVAIVAFILFITALRAFSQNKKRLAVLRKMDHWGDGEKAEANSYDGWMIFQFVAALVTGIIIMVNIPSATMRMVNPEYYAVKHLLEDLVPKK